MVSPDLRNPGPTGREREERHGTARPDPRRGLLQPAGARRCDDLAGRHPHRLPGAVEGPAQRLGPGPGRGRGVRRRAALRDRRRGAQRAELPVDRRLALAALPPGQRRRRELAPVPGRPGRRRAHRGGPDPLPRRPGRQLRAVPGTPGEDDRLAQRPRRRGVRPARAGRGHRRAHHAGPEPRRREDLDAGQGGRAALHRSQRGQRLRDLPSRLRDGHHEQRPGVRGRRLSAGRLSRAGHPGRDRDVDRLQPGHRPHPPGTR